MSTVLRHGFVIDRFSQRIPSPHDGAYLHHADEGWYTVTSFQGVVNENTGTDGKL